MRFRNKNIWEKTAKDIGLFIARKFNDIKVKGGNFSYYYALDENGELMGFFGEYDNSKKNYGEIFIEE